MTDARAGWFFRCLYGPSGEAGRAAALPAHQAFIHANRAAIRFAGPIFGDDAFARTGTWFYAEALDRPAAEAFIAGEGMNRAGLFAEIEIFRFAETTPRRRQEQVAFDPDCEHFLVACLDGPAGTDLRAARLAEIARYRAAASGLHVFYGDLMADDGSRVIGEGGILEIASRAAAERLLAGHPLADAFACRRLDRWRYGATIGSAAEAHPGRALS